MGMVAGRFEQRRTQFRDVNFQRGFRDHLDCCLEVWGCLSHVQSQKEVCVLVRKAVWEAEVDYDARVLVLDVQ